MAVIFGIAYAQATERDRGILALIVVLSWLACADGTFDQQEKALLLGIAEGLVNTEWAMSAIETAKRLELASIHLALHRLRQGSPEQQQAALTLCVGMSIVDGKLSCGEAAILRFIQECLAIPGNALATIFREATGVDLPPVGDPSQPEYFNPKASEPDSGQDQGKSAPPPPRSQSKLRSDSLLILGLGDNASAEEIRSAYLRLAKIHHPDKFAAMGPEMQQAATVIFAKIQSAFNYLMES